MIYFELLLPLTLNGENEKIREAKPRNYIILRDSKYLAQESYRRIKYFMLKVFTHSLLTMLSRRRIIQRERRLGLLSNLLVRKRKESVMSELRESFMVTPCNNNIHHFNFQLMHTT